MKDFKRKTFAQLPSVSEFGETIAAETRRLVPSGKEDIHYATLKPLVNFLEEIKAPSFNFELKLTWQEVLLGSQEMMTKLLPYILSKDKEVIKDAVVKLYRYLSEEDQPQKSDLIFVFGAKTPLRPQKAVELYKKGLAPKIMFSGGSPLYNQTEPEAENYKEIALGLGVPPEDIIIETKSITLADNVWCSLNLLEQMGINFRNIITVNSPYSQRRGSGIMQKFVPIGTTVYRVNCSTKEGLREDDWFTSEEGIKYVLTEFGKIWVSLATNTI